MRKLLSIADTLDELPIGRTKLYELIGRGELETVHIGRRVFIVGESLDEFVERLCDLGHGDS